MPLDHSHYAVWDRETDARYHLIRADVCLFRAAECRIGPNQYQYFEEAAEHLMAAGQIVLAKQVEEVVVDGFGGDLRGVEDAVRELLK